MSSEIDELESVEKILSEVKKNAVEVIKDLSEGIQGYKAFGVTSLLMFVLVLYFTFDKVMEAYPLIQRFLSTSQFALATVAIVLSGVFLAAYFALLYIGVKALLHYRHLKNKYSKLVHLSKELEGQ
nr:hypothetical protein [Candidatus Njordarchaeum guaymaensis]